MDEDLPEEDKTTGMSTDQYANEEEKVEPAARKRGRPPTIGGHINVRQKREAAARIRKEEEMEARVQRILDPTVPKGRRWEIFRDRDEELKKELTYAPTIDLQTRVMESTALMFRAADCSSKMEGSVVHALKEAAASTRAMMLILAERAREVERASGPSRRERYLEERVEKLRRKVERLEERTSPPPTPPTPSPRRLRSKRRRIAVESDEEGDVPAPSSLYAIPSSPPQMKTRSQEEGRGVKASKSHYCDGPALKGTVRKVEAYPSDVRPQDRAEYDALAKQRAELAGKQNRASVDPARIKEYVTIKAQMTDIAAKMDMLRVGERVDRSHPMPLTAPRHKEEGTKVPPSRDEEGMQGIEIASFPVLTESGTQRRKNKKKKKGKAGSTGALAASGAKTQLMGRGESGTGPTSLPQSQPGPSWARQGPQPERRRPPLLPTARGGCILPPRMGG